MDKNNLKKFLDDKSWNYDKKTIEQMMEKELEKEPEDINMEFVDACMNYLTGYSENTTPVKDKVINENKTKIRRIRFSRIMIAAIIMLISISIGVTAYAVANEMKISDVIVSIFSDYANIKYSNKNDEKSDILSPYKSTKIYKELEAGGIDNIVLPHDLYDATYENLEWHNDFTENSVGFVPKLDENVFSVLIITYTDKKWVQNPDIQGEFTSSKKIEVNGIDIYLFERDGDNVKKVTTTISYQIGLTQYYIDCPYDIETAEEFIKNMN